MRLAIFARTFSRPTLDEVLLAVRAHGLDLVHFNLACAGLDPLPETLEAENATQISAAFHRRGVGMAGVSGTFNAVHPDTGVRQELTRRCGQIISLAPRMGTRLVALCTGTRDPTDMWKRHPDNASGEAWRDLLGTLGCLLPVAENAGVTLGIEAEPNNVVDSAAKARRLLDEMASPNLKIIMDGANLFHDDLARMRDVLREALELLANDIVMAHAKDIADPGGRNSQAAGSGRLDWPEYFRLLRDHHYEGPLVLHNLAEPEVGESIAFVRDCLAHADV